MVRDSGADPVLLDFAVPHGVLLSSASVSTPSLLACARAHTAPLSGSLGYAHVSSPTPVKLACVHDPLKRMTRAGTFLEPEAPLAAPTASARSHRDELLYGSIHAPSGCMEGLWVTRLSPHWQLMATALSRAPRYPLEPLGRWLGLRPPRSASLPDSDHAMGPPGTTHLLLTLQRQCATRMSEYSYSLDDALWGARFLQHVRQLRDGSVVRAGAEAFFSIAEKSAGVSVGLRCAMPHGAASTLGWAASACPAVASVTLNPMMGYLRAAYAARIDDDLLLCTRYDFNVYSYQSDWAVGIEYKLRRIGDDEDVPSLAMRERLGVWASPQGNAAVSLREAPLPLEAGPASTPADSTTAAVPEARPLRVADKKHSPTSVDILPSLSSRTPRRARDGTEEPGSLGSARMGALKARLSASGLFSLLWEGYWRRCLVSVGLRSQLPTPASSVLGVEIMYLART